MCVRVKIRSEVWQKDKRTRGGLDKRCRIVLPSVKISEFILGQSGNVFWKRF